MTPQELDERIEDLDVDMGDYQVIPEDVKLLIRDCIEAVMPERITGRDLIAVKGSPDFTRHAAVSNIILDLVEQKTKELLG